MFLTSGTMFRGFADQANFSFNLDVSLSNTSGISAMSISGDSGRFNLFNLNSGKIYDCKNRFVRSYSSDEKLNISGNISSGNIGYFINGYPKSLNSNLCSNNFTFDNLFISTTGCNVDFSVDIWGESIPSYSGNFNNVPILTGLPITGYLVNNSTNNWQGFKIFSTSYYFPNDDYSITSNLTGKKIKQNSSGQIILNFNGGTTFRTDSNKQAYPLTGDINLSTNFGDIILPINIPLKASSSYYINFYLLSSGNNPEGTGNFWSYNLERQACSGTRFEFKLTKDRWYDIYNPFSGSFIINSGYNNGSYSGSLINYISGKNAYVGTGYISGAGCSGSDIFNTKFDILHNNKSGVLNNRMIYTISGIDENFIFSGFLTE
jgi:hypothetical protein